MISRLKLGLALGGVLALVVAFGAWRVDANAYARGVRDQQIKTIAATEMLNAGLREVRAKARDAARNADTLRGELADLERELADERALDPLALGKCISPDGMRRIFRVPGAN